MAGCVHVKVFVRSITVEPIMALYMMSIFINYPAFQALLYRKLCISHYNETFCDLINNKTAENITFKEEEDVIQSQTSHWILMNQVATTVPSCIAVLFFLSTLVDKVSHKLAIIVTTLGTVVMSVSNLIGSFYIDIPVSYLLIGSILNGFGGGFIAMMMAIYSYITSITTDHNKTFRVSVVESMIFLAGTIGVFTSGLMVDKLGFIFTYSFTTGLLVVVVIYVLIWLPDIEPDNSSAVNERQGWCSMLTRLYGIFEFVLKEREERKKLFMWLMILALLLIMVSTSGELDIMFLYVTRSPLSWSPTTYGYFKGLENFLRGIMLVTILPVLKFKLNMKDTTLIIIGLVSKTIGLIFYSFRITSVIFTGGVISMLMGFPSAGLRSGVSRLVDKDEHGRLFGLIASLESIASLVATLLFNEVYPVSLSFYPGFCFILAAAIVVLGMIIVLWLHITMSASNDHYGNLELSKSTTISDEVVNLASYNHVSIQ